ncbi:hypothetical protein BCR33DRAFT_720778 [Rhizoclosmatium globosum]|uniref:RNI-like protein n=1 Tax=Rhizoclosmatium globosum TaxID=329046 RepID=A0A1Y2BUH9_9FUNG|nr:hypothetical protein BCR33DRAFT_720778 [Rhizoclosmatium globosum]|eukprot:ORY38411.1 hypothetical protein BCR33DRAFT_720778 [Rhizoclosmatium globosum]
MMPGTAIHLEQLPNEILVAIMIHCGPLASNLRNCFYTSKTLNAAAWQALAHRGIQFEHMAQRKRFAELLMMDLQASQNLKQEYSSLAPETSNTNPPTYPHSLSPSGDSAIELDTEKYQFSTTPLLNRAPFRTLIQTLRHIDFGFRPNTPVGIPRGTSEPSTPPNTPFPIGTAAAAAAATASSSSTSSSSELDFQFYGNQWDHRFIAEELILMILACPNLRSLNLSGCQVKHEHIDTLVDALRRLPFGIEKLDLSSSSLKGWALVAIVQACGSSLKVLNISGLFRFRRNNASILYKIIETCPNLQRLIAKQCPDIDQDLFMDVSLMTPQLKFVRDKRVSHHFGPGGGKSSGSVFASLASSTTVSSVSSSMSSLSGSNGSSEGGSPLTSVSVRLDRVVTIDEE